MSCSTYTQHPLARAAPEGVKPTGRVRFNVTLAAEKRRVVLRMEQDGRKVPLDYIAIEQDTLVEIVLHGDQLFFSHAFDAITTKAELGFFYGGIEHDGYDAKLDRYRIARFVARYNRGGKVGTIHPFNLNVDFLQDIDDNGPKWIGLTIDPDIKNPPPMVVKRPE
jgi:hypothetical protein